MTLEHELEEHEKIIESFRRVKEGKKFSLYDLHVVSCTLMERSKCGLKEKVFNLENIISILEHEGELMNEVVSGYSRKMRIRRLDLDRIRRQRRLQDEKMRKEKGLEK